jgi:hypothetical protein
VLVGAIAFVVLILVPVAIAAVIAERRTRQMKGNKVRREKDERNAMSRLVAGMGRWGSSSGGGGAG